MSENLTVNRLLSLLTGRCRGRAVPELRARLGVEFFEDRVVMSGASLSSIQIVDQMTGPLDPQPAPQA